VRIRAQRRGHRTTVERQGAQGGEDEPQQVGEGQHDLRAQRPTEQQSQRGEGRGAQRDHHRAQGQGADLGAPSQRNTDGAQQDRLQEHHGDHGQ